MTDQELKNLVAFCAWIHNHNLIGASPTALADKYQSIMQSDNPDASLDLESLNLYTNWLKTWRPDLAPEGGATPPEHLTHGNL